MHDRNVYKFVDLINSGVLLVSDGYRAKNEELGGDGPIFLRAAHVTDSHIDLSGVDRFQKEIAGKVASKLSQAGDVIVTTKGNSTGRVAFVDESLPPFVYSPHLSFWRSLDQNVVWPGFLRYWSRGHEFRDQLNGLAASTDMAPYLSLVDQKRLCISLPEISEQRGTAGVLGALDDKIDLSRRMNEPLETIAREIFKSWFVNFDPAQEGQPWGFTQGTIGDLAGVLRNGVDPAEFEGEIFDHYSIPAFDEARLPKLDTGIEIKSLKFTVPSGVVLLSKLNPRIPRVWMPAVAKERRSICSTEFLVVAPLELVEDRDYLYSLFSSPDFSERFAARVTGTSGSHQRVRAEDLLKMECRVPESSARRRYSETVRPLFDRIALNQKESLTLATLRDTLLPKLLSGEIRVKQAEKMVGEAV
jgi:type I restriction enzyme S subunit